MKRINLITKLLFVWFFAVPANSQVTIGTLDAPHESAVLELKSDNQDKGMLFPHVSLQAVWDSVAVPKAAEGLLVYNTTDSDPSEVINISERVKSGKFYVRSGSQWVQLISKKQLVDDIEVALSSLGIARPALFTLDGTVRLVPQYYPEMRGLVDLLRDVPAGSSVPVPLKEQVNLTNGMVTMAGTSAQPRVILKPGVYEIKFVYEFVPADTAESGTGTPPSTCLVSCYFMEFPVNRVQADGSISQLFVKVYSTCNHAGTYFANHGNTINYVTVILEDTEWPVRFGRAAGGSCTGVRGFAMPNRSTFLSISRVGDFQID